MKAIIKRNLKNYLKNPIFWIGLIVVLISMYQTLAPLLWRFTSPAPWSGRSFCGRGRPSLPTPLPCRRRVPRRSGA